MNIFTIIDAADYKTSLKAMDPDKHMITLNHGEYDFLYRELLYKNSFHYTDENNNVNFIIKIPNLREVQTIMKNKKTVGVTREEMGPGIEIKIDGVDTRYIFFLGLDKVSNLYALKRILRTHEVYVHFVLLNGTQCVHCFSSLLRIDDRIFERLIYMLDIASKGEYPRIDFLGFDSGTCDYFVIDGDTSALEELLEIMDKLQKWGVKDAFNVYLEAEQGYKVMLEGKVENTGYIKKEIAKKYRIIDEGTCIPAGKPFIKYDKGMLYYFKSNVELLEEVEKQARD